MTPLTWTIIVLAALALVAVYRVVTYGRRTRRLQRYRERVLFALRHAGEMPASELREAIEWDGGRMEFAWFMAEMEDFGAVVGSSGYGDRVYRIKEE